MSTERLRRNRALALAVRAFGILDLLALGAIVMPVHWMDQAHRFFGMGPLPRDPIVGYLARSSSTLYALHGAMLVLMSFDVERYRPLIRFLAYAAFVHGAIIVGIDVAEQIPPVWWRNGEGPCYAAMGALLLWLDRAR